MKENFYFLRGVWGKIRIKISTDAVLKFWGDPLKREEFAIIL